ncbi:ABC transporter ATP-binding protein [Longimicrobium terrae]|uniref:ATP-binding cassette subfamily B protein n=1 Tax=Longimicrobium terrae TaxID=1639882 RepID=A0A841H0D7_9BACT|nr:ABC transporter ATP-binding protein [Longimicrobium terrae]MBB4636983.1 ATP-binding cassette subfamily B protein [Longimicrobium terrae]MBB6071409.1 ATP-binding cassette subfamily B protein [Longimicrobium terrae]NNC31376.1 ABC transporter ATP-binding protein [Longimicrobium terrae]
MREHGRAVALLVGAAWRTDPWRTAGLLLEPLGQLRIPLFAWFLKLLTDGAVRQDTRLLALGAGGIVATRVLWFLGSWTGGWIRNRLAEEVGFVLDREIATLSAELPGLEHHERPDYQDRLELLRQQQGVLGTSLNTLIYTANTVVTGVGTLVALALVSPWLLLLVPFALPAIPSAAAQQRWLRDAEERSGPAGRRARHLQALTVDRAAGMELRVFGLERELLARFRRSATEARGFVLAVRGRAALLDLACDVLFLAGFGGAMALMLWRAGRGQATAGEVVMALYLGQQMMSSVVEPVRRVGSLGETLRAAGRLVWLQDYARAARQALAGTRAPPERLADGIVFDRVSFRYPGTDRWALRDVSFCIPAGSVIALVGENGAGKTTVVKLLSRMYEPTEGRILVDGTDLAEIELDGWRKRLSAAFQDFARFELPARQTVGAGHLPRVDDSAAVQAALERAGAEDVLRALPAGLDTQLGARWEAGVDLSTGQWQRLALGRALMREDPLVVFFDEPTASLDAMAEHALFERYAREARSGSARGAVTVLVSHRFSTVRSADLILVIEDGRVSQLGAHHELMRGDGLYAELYSMQARSYQ